MGIKITLTGADALDYLQRSANDDELAENIEPGEPEVFPEVPSETVVLDEEGLPWDERIHSSNHKMTQNGIWVKRKGIDVDERRKIINELKNTPEPEPEPVLEENGVEPVAANPEINLSDLMAHITKNNLELDVVTQACASAGLSNLAELAGSPQLVPNVAEYLGMQL